MDECKEQQLQELEALESMYANKGLAIVCRDYPNISLEIEIRPDSTEFQRKFGREVAKFHATLPAEYPNIGPQIDLTSLETIDVDEEEEENGEDKRRNDGVAEEQQRLLVTKVREKLEKAVEESIGTPMLVTLINTFKESLVQVCMAGESGESISNSPIAATTDSSSPVGIAVVAPTKTPSPSMKFGSRGSSAISPFPIEGFQTFRTSLDAIPEEECSKRLKEPLMELVTTIENGFQNMERRFDQKIDNMEIRMGRRFDQMQQGFDKMYKRLMDVLGGGEDGDDINVEIEAKGRPN